MKNIINQDEILFYEDFMKNIMPKALKNLQDDTKALWGKMQAQDMVEHLEVNILTSMILKDVPHQTPNKKQVLGRNLIYTKIKMGRNLSNPSLKYGLPPHKYQDVRIAVNKLIEKISLFFNIFAKKPTSYSLNMFLGDLNYAENLAFHYKHCKHHITQFGLIEDDDIEEYWIP